MYNYINDHQIWGLTSEDIGIQEIHFHIDNDNIKYTHTHNKITLCTYITVLIPESCCIA